MQSLVGLQSADKTIGQYRSNNRPISVMGKMADNWPIPIIGRYRLSADYPFISII